MSYWIYLKDGGEDGATLPVESHEEGGTYCLGGTPEAMINVTYNYAKHFTFRDLHLKKAKETEPALAAAVEKLGTKQDDDYWKPTEGNVGYCCKILLDWAKQHPEGVWVVH